MATNSEPKSPLWVHLSHRPPSLTLSALISNTAWQCNPQKGGGGRKSSITELYVGQIISGPVSSYLPSSLIQTPPPPPLAPAQNTKLGWKFLTPFPTLALHHPLYQEQGGWKRRWKNIMILSCRRCMETDSPAADTHSAFYKQASDQNNNHSGQSATISVSFSFFFSTKEALEIALTPIYREDWQWDFQMYQYC